MINHIDQQSGTPLVRALMNPALYDHPVERFELVETHISWVLLTGPYAYKIKKPVDLGFLDFSTLPKRLRYCREELRLNQRLAPQLYLGVVPITGRPDQPAIGGTGPVIEYAVKMKQFPQDAQLDRVVARCGLTSAQVDALAVDIASFHRQAAVAEQHSPFGTPDGVMKPIRENFETIRHSTTDPSDVAQIEHLRAWSEADHAAHHDDYLDRKQAGAIRECHGDLHTRNMVLIDDRVVVFDCLEFDEALRWIDVMSDLAFLIMDLDDRGHSGLANRLLSGYLEVSGDYAGLRVFRTYRVYRAMVRAKVDCIRMGQMTQDDPERATVRQDYRSYTDLAERYTQPVQRWLLIMHGLSGSGKSLVSQALVEASGTLRVRSDVERKRLFGLPADAPTASGLGADLYSPDVNRRTYDRLADLARTILSAGYPVIVDAACLQRWQRDRLRAIAVQLRLPFIILQMQAPESTLRERVARREREGKDASEAGLAVLEHQLATQEPLASDEKDHALTVETGATVDIETVASSIERMARGGSARS